MDAQAGDLALGVERELGVRHVIAAVRVRQERFRSLRRPFDRPVDLLGRPRANRLLGIDEDLRAEAAADVRSDHAQLVFRRESDERREDEPRDMRVLARRVERDRIGSGVVFADRGARLHRIRDQPVVYEVELGHVRSPGKGRIGGSLVAHVPIEHGIVWRRVVDLRLTGIGGGRGVDGGRQLAIVDNYLLRRFARLCISIGDHDGDMVADVANFALSERRMSAGLHRRSVLRMDHPAADEAADLVGRDVVAGEDCNHAGRFQGGGSVDLLDRRMRVRRAQKIGVGLSRTVDVVDVVPLAGDEANVFAALDGGADAGRAHEFSLP